MVEIDRKIDLILIIKIVCYRLVQALESQFSASSSSHVKSC